MWKVIGASVTGTSHQAAGKACEDAAGWRTGQGLTCLAVADGAGSRPRSGAGAALAVERALARACAGADGQADGQNGDGEGGGDPAAWVRQIFEDARDQIAVLASADGNEPDDYATTLAVAILTSRLVIIGQVGDAIAVAGHQGRYQTMAPAPRGEYVNETTFITGPGALAELRITVTPAAEVDTVVLGTDGLRFKVLDLPAGVPFTPFFEDLAAYARSPRATEDAVRRFLDELDDQSGDDKTLVAAVRT
jgi:hypothetical protein